MRHILFKVWAKRGVRILQAAQTGRIQEAANYQYQVLCVMPNHHASQGLGGNFGEQLTFWQLVLFTSLYDRGNNVSVYLLPLSTLISGMACVQTCSEACFAMATGHWLGR